MTGRPENPDRVRSGGGVGREIAIELIRAHPRLFSTEKLENRAAWQRSNPHFGLQWVPLGWQDLVGRLCDDLEPLVPDPIPEGFGVVQIKSKFAELRFYIHMGNPGMLARIELASEESRRTCEDCGKPGRRISVKGWLRTVCPTHESLEEAR
jgi:hypothetical protein